MTPRRFVTLLLLVGVLGAFPSARAHHSWPANYDVDQVITLEGDVLAYLWRNPHVFIYLEVTNEQGEIEKWEIEWANTNAMVDRGFAADSFSEGDHIIVRGWPGRSAVKRMNLQELDRPADGLSYSTGRL